MTQSLRIRLEPPVVRNSTMRGSGHVAIMSGRCSGLEIVLFFLFKYSLALGEGSTFEEGLDAYWAAQCLDHFPSVVRNQI